MFSGSKFRRFSLDEIKDATNNFDERHAIGGGGEGKVYLAQIILGSSKTTVAVKDLKPKAFAGFEHELETMPKMQHPNILSLLGYCDEAGKKILVYEYMANGRLADYVVIKQPKSSSTSTKISLSWQQRLKICVDAALGLQHFHSETDEFSKGNIHRDIKPENILLDADWVAKISDFGIIKSSYAGQIESEMLTGLKGTSGYYAPEYVKYRQVTRKADVYAFGVLLFQVLCRKMPWDHGGESYYATDNEDYTLWAQQNVDSQIKGEISIDSLEAFTEIIGRSLKDEPRKRPTMDDVVLSLQKSLKCQERKDDTKKLRAAREPIVLDIGANSDPKHEDPATQLRLHPKYLGSPKDDEHNQKRFFEPSFDNKVLKLYTTKVPCNSDDEGPGRVWGSISLNHLASFDTLAMDSVMKIAIMNDLKMFVNRKEFYKKVGKAWKRGYLLYGPPRTGKSTLVAAMANYLRFDMYELQLCSVHSDSDLWRLLLSTTKRSIIVIDDIAEMQDKGAVNGQDFDATMMLSSLLNFVDGLWADEQIIVFTTNHIEKLDPALLIAGRMDMYIQMSYCTYQGFRILASNYLGIHDHHRLFDKIKDLIEDVQITPPEIIAELMQSDDVDLALDGIVGLLEYEKLKRLDDWSEGSGH